MGRCPHPVLLPPISPLISREKEGEPTGRKRTKPVIYLWAAKETYSRDEGVECSLRRRGDGERVENVVLQEAAFAFPLLSLTMLSWRHLFLSLQRASFSPTCYVSRMFSSPSHPRVAVVQVKQCSPWSQRFWFTCRFPHI